MVLLIGLTVSHIVSMTIYSNERLEVLTLTGSEESARRIASIAQLVNEVPREWRGRILDAVRSSSLRVTIDAKSIVNSDSTESWRSALIHRFLTDQVQGRTHTDILVQFEEAPVGPTGFPAMMSMSEMHAHMGRSMALMAEGWPVGAVLHASIRLDDGNWLNFDADIPESPSLWSTPAILSMALMAITVILFALWAVQRMTAPLRRFADASERLGRDVRSQPLSEEGPIEIRQAARAFNQMQGRLRRHIENRTQMLAAVSHDLRTPITQLRLRAEFIDDEQEQAKTLETLAEMEAMIASTLSFARDDAQQEAPRIVDVSALVAAICDDLAETGMSVEWNADEKIPYRCRSSALKRAITNLIENAVKYGRHADVDVCLEQEQVRITVEDKGPGIPDDELTNVFSPFYRVEKSRSSKTGGVGLGLSVARTIVHAHGGEIKLEALKEGGLRAFIELPR